MSQTGMKFCKHCGAQIAAAAVICPHCGCQVEEVRQQAAAQPNIVINNANSNTNAVYGAYGKQPRALNKWTAFFLCLVLGFFGAHKFYEKKTLLGIVYLCTGGLFVIGWFIDTIALLFKPNPYFV